MPGQNIRIQQTSIAGGQASVYYAGADGQYQYGIAIDPEALKDGVASGMIVPIAHSKFSGTEIDGYPLYILKQPHTTNYYVLTTAGKLHSFDKTHTMRGTDEKGTSLPISLPDAAANGGVYHDNFLVISEDDDITRYGPLVGQSGDATDAVEINGFWSSRGAQWSLGSYSVAAVNSLALSSITTAEINGIPLPKHPLKSHEDSVLIGDFIEGRGVLHRLKTASVLLFDAKAGDFTVGLTVTGGTSGATGKIVIVDIGISTGTLTLINVSGTFQDNENVTDTSTGNATVDGLLVPGAASYQSAYRVLRLPKSLIPATIESYGTNIVVGGNYTTSVGSDQGKAELVFWDNTSPGYYNRIILPDPIVTAQKYHNGILHVWSGNGRSGYRVSRYIGGQTTQTIWQSLDGFPPFEGAIDTDGNRLIWPHNGKRASLTVGSVGSLYTNTINAPVFHQIARPSDADANVTAVATTEQEAATSRRTIVVGWGDGTTYGLDEPSASGTFRSVFRTKTQVVGREFRVTSIKIPLGAVIAANMTITPTLYVDGEIANEALTVINNTNFSNSERMVTLFPKLSGYTDFFLQFEWSGTVALPVLVPITFILGLQQT